MKVLVTGDRGYIGTVLVPMLAARPATRSSAWMSGWYDGCDFGPQPGGYESRTGDIRDQRPEDLDGFDAVVNLAAISNDPVGHLNPEATYSVNAHGAAHLAQVAHEAGVPRYVFSSSCSLYGAAGDGAVTEESDFNPVTPYGQSKVMAEQLIGKFADDDFSPTYLRNATAYGSSPRLRADIVVNNLTGAALTRGEVRLQSDGSPWRPLVHAEDISRAFLAVAGGRPGGRPRPGVQRRPRRGRRPDPHHRRRWSGADRRPGHLRRGRLAGQARLPGRLRQDRSPAARLPAGLDGAGRDRRAGHGHERYGLRAEDFEGPRSCGCNASTSCATRGVWTTASDCTPSADGSG